MRVFDLSAHDSRAEACLYIANYEGAMQVIIQPERHRSKNALIRAYKFKVRLLAAEIGICPDACDLDYVRPALFGYDERSDKTNAKAVSIKELSYSELYRALNSFHIFGEFFPGIQFE